VGLISTAAFILATQLPPNKGENLNQSEPGISADEVESKPKARIEKSAPQVPADRMSEIWDHIDNRINTQSDIWFEDGQFPQCISLLRVQHAYSPNDYDVMTSLGWMLENVQEMDHAREIYLQFSQRFPNNGDAIFALGNSYYATKDWDKAIKYLEPSLAKSSGPDSYIVVAKSYERQGKLADALRIWELELKNFPEIPTAIVNIKRVKAKIASGGK
jgi:tetratricopeptide (TPR) repeat protein